tara:strand:+ start:424 stop:1248 length:825 start_codon:yes stop_codon:yes gene_type:complete
MNTAQVYELRQSTMPSENGFTPLWRDIKKQPWYKQLKGRYTFIFTHMLLEACHKPRTVNFYGVDVQLLPGQFAKSYEQLARETGLSKSDIQNAIKLFKKYEQITVVNMGKFSVFAFKKWSKFNTANNTLKNTPQPASGIGLEQEYNTGKNTGKNTQNNNDLEQQVLVPKGTCQNSGEFKQPKIDKTPYGEILNLYHELLPNHNKVIKYDSLKPQIRARHREMKDGLNSWRNYFNHIREKCTWMTSGNYPNAEKLKYLVNKTNFEDIVNGGKNDR